MISISSPKDDPIAGYGITHFIQTAGLSVQPDIPSDSGIGIGIGYEGQNNGAFSITVTKNSAIDLDAGDICWKNTTCPILQTPIDTSPLGDICFAKFCSENDLYPCISGRKSEIVIGFDIFRLTGTLLSGLQDTQSGKERENGSTSKILVPLVDFYEDLLFQTILKGCQERSIPFIRKSHWPKGRKFAVCLTHDVDEVKKTYQWVTHPLRCIVKKDFSGIKNQLKALSIKVRGHEPYWTFDDIIQNERMHSVHSTYFFLKESGNKSLFKPNTWHLYGRNHSFRNSHVIKLMTDLAESGHEIGVHGSTCSYNDPLLLKNEKDEIENLLKQNVIGIRQHRLNMDIPQTWEYQSQTGFLYDTSLGYKAIDGAGFRWGTCFPFHPVGSSDIMSLLEIPLSLMDVSLPKGNEGWNICDLVINEVEERGGVLTLLWHPPAFNDLEYPDLGSWYWKIIKECKEKDAWVMTGREIYFWWLNRESTIFDYDVREGGFIIMGDFSTDCYFDVYSPNNEKLEIISGNATVIGGNENHDVICTSGKTVSNEIVVRFR